MRSYGRLRRCEPLRFTSGHRRHLPARPQWASLVPILSRPVVGGRMRQIMMLSRTVLVAGGTLIAGTAALGQGTPPPTLSPAAPAASQLAPPATTNPPGYPPIGPADPKLRVVDLPSGKR